MKKMERIKLIKHIYRTKFLSMFKETSFWFTPLSSFNTFLNTRTWPFYTVLTDGDISLIRYIIPNSINVIIHAYTHLASICIFWIYIKNKTHWFKATCDVADIRNPACYKTRILFPIRFSKDQDFPRHFAFCLTPVGVLCTIVHDSKVRCFTVLCRAGYADSN